jgi:nicotinate-nucleotide adenylyltransferase
VAIYGGSFNPPHIAHQMAALYVLETASVDELWLVPACRHAFGKPLAPFSDRVQMCELAARALGPRVKVSDIEGAIGGESRTLRTIRRLQAMWPDHVFSLVIGADLVDEVPSWQGGAELQATGPFIVVGRGGVAKAEETEGAERVAMPAVSSSSVRQRLAVGQSVERLVPRLVLDYISERKLYQGSIEERS